MNGDLNNQQPGMMPTQPMAPQQPGMVPTPPAAPAPVAPAPAAPAPEAPVAPVAPAPVAPAAPVAPQDPMMATQPAQPPMPPQPPMGQPMEQPVAPAPAPQEPKKKSNILFVIIILLMVAILVFLGKFILDGDKKNEGPKDNKTTTLTTSTTTTTTTKPVSQQKTVTCTLHQDMSSQGYTLDGTYTVYYTDGVVDKAHTVETVNSSSVDILNYFDTNVKTTYNQLNQSYGGYTYRTTINGTKFEAVTDIDYSVMNVNAYANDNPSLKPYIKNGKMTVELVLSSYRQMGASCPTTV